MVGNFNYQNITFKKHEQTDSLVMTGEITNKSTRNFHSVVFRVVLFIKNIPIGNVAITINGFLNNQTRKIEKQIGELQYSKVIKEIIRYKIFAESAY